MADIVKELSNIGRLVSESTLIEAFNNYKAENEQVYCIDISSELKRDPKHNADPTKYIVTRFKESASNAGNLYPSIKRNRKDHGKATADKLFEYSQNFLDFCPTVYDCMHDKAYLVLKNFVNNRDTHIEKLQGLITDSLKIPSSDGKEFAGAQPFCFFLTYNQKPYSEIYPDLFVSRINKSDIATNLSKFNMLETQKKQHAIAVFMENDNAISVSTILDTADRTFAIEKDTIYKDENLEMLLPSAKIAKNKKSIFEALIGIQTKVQNLLNRYGAELDVNLAGMLTQFGAQDHKHLEKTAADIAKILKNLQINLPIFLYFTFQYRPVAAHLSRLFSLSVYGDSDSNNVEGEDFITGEKVIGSDPQLNFMSLNELPKAMQVQKVFMLPLNAKNAMDLKKGFQFFDKAMSFNLYYKLTKTNLKIGVLPTVLSKHNELEIDEIYQMIYGEYNTIQNRHSKTSEDMKDAEESVIYNLLPELEDLSKFENNLPVINTIVIYEQSSAKRTMHTTIPDVLPSYILRQSQLLQELSLILFPIKDRKEPKLSELFQDYIETFEVMFSRVKLSTDQLIAKLTKAMLYGTARSNALNEQYYPFVNLVRMCGSNPEFNYERTIRNPDTIVRIAKFFNEMEKTAEKLILRKEMDSGMEWKLNESASFEEAVNEYFEQTAFIHKDKSLEVMYLLGMLSAALIKWQLGVMKGTSSFGKWLNNLGQINEKNITRIFDKFDEGYRKTKQTAYGFDNCKIEVLLSHYANAYRGIEGLGQQSRDEATMAFVFGMSDYKNIVKTSHNCHGKMVEAEQEEITFEGEEDE